MKKIRTVLLLISVLLLSGCSGIYNLRINDDLSVEEKINLKIPFSNENFDKTNKLFDDNNVDKQNYDIVASDDNIKINYNKKYDSVEDYILNSKLYKQLFENIDYSNNGEELKLSAEAPLKLDDSNISNAFDVSLLQINIETPLKIISTNSSSISNDTNTWSLNKDTTYKKIYIKLGINNKNSNYISTIVLTLIIIISVVSIITILLRFLKTKKI